MPVKSYNPASVSIVRGTKLISGYADGTFVTIERMTDTWSDQVGSDGEVSRAKNNDQRGTVTIVLTQTSPSNDDLDADATADELTGNAAAPLLVRDASGRTICSGDTSWIVKKPSLEFGREVGPRTWVIRVANLVQFSGGNS